MSAPAESLPELKPPRCQQHPRALAGWRCQSCDAALCPDCAVGQRSQTVELVACGRCGGGALPLLVHRAHRESLARRLKGAWRYIFTASGLQVLVAVGATLAFLGWLQGMTFLFLKVLPLVFYGSVFWGTFHTLVRATARGDRELDTPELSDFLRDAILPGVRGLTAFVLVWLPALLYVFVLRPGSSGLRLDLFGELMRWKLPPGLLADPVLWALLVLGAAWLPMALLLTAAEQPLLSVLDVVGGARRAKRLGRDYLLTVGALALLGVLHAVAHGVAYGVRALDVFIVSRVLAEMVTLAVPFTAAHVVGLLLYVRGDALGYGADRDYLEPVLGGARPRSAAPSIRDEALLPGGAPEAAVADGKEEQAGGLSALASAVEARDVPQAMALYATLGQLPSVRVPPEHHLFIGQAAATEGNFPLAVQALERAADVAPDEPTAPRALVLLARVLGERMQDAGRAEEVYRYVLHRYPDTSAARFARERVGPSSD